MKEFDYYSDFPTVFKADHVRVYIYSRGEVLGSVPLAEFSRGNWPDTAVIEQVVDEESLKQARTAAQELRNSKLVEFKQDLFEEFDATNNPLREGAFRLAWEYGHSSGFESVYNYFSDMIDVVSGK